MDGLQLDSFMSEDRLSLVLLNGPIDRIRQQVWGSRPWSGELTPDLQMASEGGNETEAAAKRRRQLSSCFNCVFMLRLTTAASIFTTVNWSLHHSHIDHRAHKFPPVQDFV